MNCPWTPGVLTGISLGIAIEKTFPVLLTIYCSQKLYGGKGSVSQQCKLFWNTMIKDDIYGSLFVNLFIPSLCSEPAAQVEPWAPDGAAWYSHSRGDLRWLAAKVKAQHSVQFFPHQRGGGGQCCGTVTIFYGFGSSSDFWQVSVPLPTIDKFRF